MAWARFSAESDVYVYYNAPSSEDKNNALGKLPVGGGFHCCDCNLMPDSSNDTCDYFVTPDGIATHMQAHRDNGEKVPERLLDPETFRHLE